MAKLYFRYGAMGSSKTANALMVRYNYYERGSSPVLLKPKTICPEVMGALPTPREPSEIVDGIVKRKDGTSVDDAFHRGAEAAYDAIKGKNVDCVILQSRSPSCGVHAIYDGTFSGRIIPGEGIFARLLREKGIKTIDVEEL